jgi:hypothetical protein
MPFALVRLDKVDQQAVVEPLVLRLTADNRRTDSTPTEGLDTVPSARSALPHPREPGPASASPGAEHAPRSRSGCCEAVTCLHNYPEEAS